MHVCLFVSCFTKLQSSQPWTSVVSPVVGLGCMAGSFGYPPLELYV